MKALNTNIGGRIYNGGGDETPLRIWHMYDMWRLITEMLLWHLLDRKYQSEVVWSLSDNCYVGMTFRSVSSAMHTHRTVDKHIAVSSVVLTTESSVRSSRSSSEWRHLRDSLVCERSQWCCDAVISGPAPQPRVTLRPRLHISLAVTHASITADAASSHSRHL